MSNQLSFVHLPEDIELIFSEALRGMDGDRVHPSHRDHEAMLTTATVCRAWNGDRDLNAVRSSSRVQLLQQGRLKRVHLHLQNLNQLIRKTGHTFQVTAAPNLLRDFGRTERRLLSAWSSADWTEMQDRLDRLD